MSLLLREPDLRSAARNAGRTAARRAVTRWAWRMYRREWRRQALVLALLLVAVAATVFGLGVATAASGIGPSSTFGTAGAILEIPGSDAALSSDLAAVRARFRAADVTEHESVPVPGSVSTIDVRATDPRGPFDAVTFRLRAGRYPVNAGEVAVTHGVAGDFGLHIGSSWSAGGQHLRVVGIVENPLDLLDQFALVVPGQIAQPSQVSVMVNAPQGTLRSFHLPSGVGIGIESRGHAGAATAQAAVLVLGTLGLTFVGLIAVAGFAVMANRRLRALGMLGSIGATSRHIRWVMLANGAAVGATAAFLGGVAGVVSWIAFAPSLQSMIDKHVDQFSLPWWAVASAMLLTFVTAVVAAWWPARAAGRMPVIAALSGRPPARQPSHRFAGSGGTLLAAGLVLLAFADQRRTLFVIGGTLLTVIGVLLLGPLTIRGLAALARRWTIAARLALRDLVRYGTRSGAALGAITLAVGIAATIAVSASASAAPSGPGNLAPNQLMLYLTPAGGISQIPPVDTTQMQALTAQVGRLAGDIGASLVVPLEQAYDPQSGIWPAQPGNPGGGAQPAGYQTVTLAQVISLPHGEEITGPNTLYVASDALLDAYGLKPSQIDPTADVITSQTSLTDLQIFFPTASPDQVAVLPPLRTARTVRPRFQIDRQMPAYADAPDVLLSEHAMRSLGLSAVAAGWFMETRRPLTQSQITSARHVAAAAGLHVETRSARHSNAALENWSTTAGIILALGVLAMTVGLIRSESGNDLRTLAATGAAGRTRRTLTGVTAGALALLGASLGTAGAYAGLLAWHRSHLAPLGRVPYADLTVLLVGLPLISAVGGWILSGREPSGLIRQPME